MILDIITKADYMSLDSFCGSCLSGATVEVEVNVDSSSKKGRPGPDYNT